MMIGDHEDIPKLIRVFFSKEFSRGSQNCIDFDYRAATELLRRDPNQAQYATYECKKRRHRCSQEHHETTTRSNNHDSKETSSNQTGNLFLHSPIRCACIETTKEVEAMEFLTAIRDIDPTQFLLQDSHGHLPIDGECVLNASIELISFLLEIYLDYNFVSPNGVGMTEANFNPITCLCGSYWWEDIHRANEEIRSGARIVSGKKILLDNLGIENIFWKKIILLTKAFYHKTIEEDTSSSSSSSSSSMIRISNEYGQRRVEFRLLHACAGIDWFPPNLLRLLVAAFPGALLEADEDGNLPIHVASDGFFESYKIDTSWEGDLEANSGYQKTTLDILLEANPDLAKIPDSEGRLPLELAIESSDKTDFKRWRPWEDGGIGSILRAYPEASRIRSPVSGKLPLEIALGRGSSRDWEDGVEALLEAYPEATEIRNPFTGKHPLQLAIERETHFDKGVYGLLEVSPKAAWAGAVVSLEDCFRDNDGDGLGRKQMSSNCEEEHIKNKKALLPFFAYAASENCSPSVVYKLLRTNPESCRRCFKKSSSSSSSSSHHSKKRKQNLGYYEEKRGNGTLTTPLPSLSYKSDANDPPSNKRLKSLSYDITIQQRP